MDVSGSAGSPSTTSLPGRLDQQEVCPSGSQAHQRPAEEDQTKGDVVQRSGLDHHQKPDDSGSLRDEPKPDSLDSKGPPPPAPAPSPAPPAPPAPPNQLGGSQQESRQDLEGKPEQEPEQMKELGLDPRQPQHQLEEEPDLGPDRKPKPAPEGPTEVFQEHQRRDPCSPDQNLSRPQQTPPPPEDLQPPQAAPTEVPTKTLGGEALLDQVQPPSAVPAPDGPRLCGFLQKQGGPLRTWKYRWFTYEEQKNQLFYYRTPQDVTPLGCVQLRGAALTYPPAESTGTFHIRTPERTWILKAATQELRLYWLQQLQLKRWQHRQVSSYADRTHNISSNNNKAAEETQTNNTTDEFLPVLRSPVGLVGEQAARSSPQRTPLADVSIKHPLIHFQNSMHSLMRRSSQEVRQSVFHVETPAYFQAGETAAVSQPAQPPSEPLTPPPPLPLANPASPGSLVEGRESQSPFDSRRRKTKSLSTMLMQHRDVASSEQTSRLQQEKRMLMEEVKAQKELVWILHRALEASQLEKRSCSEFLAVEGEQERLELLRHRERQATDLRRRLEEAEAAAEAASRSAAQWEAQVLELQKNILALTEKNSAKQEVIVKLSEQVSSSLNEPQCSDRPVGGSTGSPILRQLQQEVENLKDDIEAYKIQNKFLNSEIHQLTKLWRSSAEQEKNLMVKCAHLEATNCQLESRYLGVLRKLQESVGPAQQEAVQQLIDDALKVELKSVMQFQTNRDYDEYGFKIVPDYELEDMKLLSKIQALEIRSNNLLHQEAVERPLLSRWAQYLASRLDEDLCPSLELKVLVRGGIPPEYRPRVWCWMVRARTRTIRDHHPQHYQQLCEKSRTSLHPASRQIQLDLHRTLTTNQNFSSPSSPALQQLRRILLAFSWHNPVIGYCQGLNRLAAMSLLVLQSEEDAFWCLVAVVESIMPQDYYTKSLIASQADQQVLKDFMVEKLPQLAAHLEEHSVDVSLVTFNWFLVVFVESLPSAILLPVWDAFLYEGTKVMFRYALALFKYKEEDILKLSDSVEIYQYLRFFTKTISDTRKLTSIAFNDMNPFPRRQLRNRRVFHLDRLQRELCELEEQQKEFLTESAEHKDKDVDAAASEDDDDL